jgi:hypothetical protein
MRRIGLKNCPYCDAPEVFRSRTEPTTWMDRARGLFLLQLVRCHLCMHRHYRPAFLPAPEYRLPIGVEKHAPTSVEADKRERSA